MSRRINGFDVGYVKREIGNCLTETKVADFDEVLHNYDKFAIISQFNDQPMHADQCQEDQIVSSSSIYNGTILYGIELNGDLTFLGQIIDSSD